MIKNLPNIMSISVLSMVLSVSSAQAFWWPPVQSKVVIVLRGSATSFSPARFDYTLTHLGTVLHQGSVPLTPSHHSLIAAGNQYQAYENSACSIATGIAPHPLGLPLKVERVNYYLMMPANIRQVINKTQTDCP